jgi:ParB/RepB/Spo0J family partition protein
MKIEKEVNIKSNKEGVSFAPTAEIEVEEGFNIRRNTEPEQELVDSAKEHGVIHPIHVRFKDRKKSKLFIIDGERRWKAAKLAKVGSVPIVNHGFLGDKEAFVISLTANDNQKKLSRSEQFAGFRRLKEEGLNAETIARVMSVNRRTVDEALIVLEKASKAVKVAAQKGLREGGISPRVAGRAAASLPKKVQDKIANKLVGASQKEGLETIRKEEQKLGITRPGVKAAPARPKPAVSPIFEPGFEARAQELETHISRNIVFAPSHQPTIAQRSMMAYLKGKEKITLEYVFPWEKH